MPTKDSSLRLQVQKVQAAPKGSGSQLRGQEKGKNHGPQVRRESGGSVSCLAEPPAGAVSSCSMTAGTPQGSSTGVTHRKASHRTRLRADTPAHHGRGDGPCPACPVPTPAAPSPASGQKQGCLVHLSTLGCPGRGQREPFVTAGPSRNRDESQERLRGSAPSAPRCEFKA